MQRQLDIEKQIALAEIRTGARREGAAAPEEAGKIIVETMKESCAAVAAAAVASHPYPWDTRPAI